MNNRNKEEYKNGTSSSVYNRLRKKNLAEQCDIRCSHCGWNSGENSSDKWYGSISHRSSKKRIRFPSWKLATKNRRQWQEKPKSYRIDEKLDKWTKRSYLSIRF